MKKLIFAVVMAVGAMALAAETKPGEKPKYVDPNPFANYDVAMKDSPSAPFAVGWSQVHDKEIREATAEAKIAEIVEHEKTIRELFARVKGAYESDPLVLTQIAAITQWVMLPPHRIDDFFIPFQASARQRWQRELRRAIDAAADPYVKTFFTQQLDLCK